MPSSIGGYHLGRQAFRPINDGTNMVARLLVYGFPSFLWLLQFLFRSLFNDAHPALFLAPSITASAISSYLPVTVYRPPLRTPHTRLDFIKDRTWTVVQVFSVLLLVMSLSWWVFLLVFTLKGNINADVYPLWMWKAYSLFYVSLLDLSPDAVISLSFYTGALILHELKNWASS